MWHELQNPQRYDLVIAVDSVYYLTDPLSEAHFRLLRPNAEIMAYYSTYEPTPASHSVMCVDEVVTSKGIVSNPCGQLAPYRHPNIRLSTPGAIKHFCNGFRHFELHRCLARSFRIELVHSLDLSKPIANPGTFWAQTELAKIDDPTVSPLVRELRARATTLAYDKPYEIVCLEVLIPVLATLRYRANENAGRWYEVAWIILASIFADSIYNYSRSAIPLGLLTLGCIPLNSRLVNRSTCIVLAIASCFLPLTGVTGLYFARSVILNYLPRWINGLFDRSTQFAAAIAGYEGSHFDLARQIEPCGSSRLIHVFLGASPVRLERLRDGYSYGRSLRTLSWLPSFLAPLARLDDFIPPKVKGFSTNLDGVPVGNYLVSTKHKPGSIQLNPRSTDTEINRS